MYRSNFHFFLDTVIYCNSLGYLLFSLLTVLKAVNRCVPLIYMLVLIRYYTISITITCFPGNSIACGELILKFCFSSYYGVWPWHAYVVYHELFLCRAWSYARVSNMFTVVKFNRRLKKVNVVWFACRIIINWYRAGLSSSLGCMLALGTGVCGFDFVASRSQTRDFNNKLKTVSLS